MSDRDKPLPQQSISPQNLRALGVTHMLPKRIPKRIPVATICKQLEHEECSSGQFLKHLFPPPIFTRGVQYKD